MNFRVVANLLSAFLVCLNFVGIQSNEPDVLDDVSDRDVFDGFVIGNVAYLFRDSELPGSDNAVFSLAKLIGVDRAAIHGAPDQSEQELINQSHDWEMQTSVSQLAAINFGGSGFIWKVEHEISPVRGGSTGLPPTFLAYVKGDGSVIKADRFLLSCANLHHGSRIYSILSFEDLTHKSRDTPLLDGENVLELARAAVNSFCTEALKDKLAVQFRFHDQTLLQIPVRVRNTGEIVSYDIWRVQFTISEDTTRSTPIALWVTKDGLVSNLSLDSWDATNRRVN